MYIIYSETLTRLQTITIDKLLTGNCFIFPSTKPNVVYRYPPKCHYNATIKLGDGSGSRIVYTYSNSKVAQAIFVYLARTPIRPRAEN